MLLHVDHCFKSISTGILLVFFTVLLIRILEPDQMAYLTTLPRAGVRYICTSIVPRTFKQMESCFFLAKNRLAQSISPNRLVATYVLHI